jgi:tetratricopeptide (TPR) repeat protein
MHHPTLEEFEAFSRGELATPEVRQVIAHLLTSCTACKRLASSVYRQRDSENPATLAAHPDRREADAVGRVLATARAMAVRPRAPREEPQNGRPAAHRGGVRAVERLLDRSWKLRYQDPQEMIRVASRAVRLAFRLPVDGHEERTVADCRARAYAVLGNAYRVADRLDDATSTLEIAEGLRRQGSGDESLLASLSTFRASLHSARREFDIALHLITRVFEIHTRRGERQLAGRALISKAIFTAYAGNPEEALEICDAGLASIDRDADPSLHFVALQNRLSYLVECDRLDEACQSLEEIRRVGSDGILTRLRLSWVEGRIFAGRGELERARKQLLAVQQTFKSHALLYSAAVVALDLAVVELKLTQSERARRTVETALQVFTTLRIPREALAATLLLHQAAEQGALCVALLERVSDRLRRST